MKLLWLSPILDPDFTLSSKAVSPAANRWQLSLLNSLEESSVNNRVLSYLPEPVWPKGKLRIPATKSWFPSHIDGSLITYLNFPFLRKLSIAQSYKILIKSLSNDGIQHDAIVTYNNILGLSDAARYARKLFKSPWVCIVADGDPPKGADGYIYLSWQSFSQHTHATPKLHLDGGVNELEAKQISYSQSNNTKSKYIFMYNGNLGNYAGLDLLVKAFQEAKIDNSELWITGKGRNSQVRNLLDLGPGIRYFGLLGEHELLGLMRKADCFVNPRPSLYPGNEKNFPSKLLEYLSFDKPIVSTMSPGIHPAYADFLISSKIETVQQLSKCLCFANNLNASDLDGMLQKARDFSMNHTWQKQADRFCQWIRNDLITQAWNNSNVNNIDH